jgi:hypothetical protein
MSELKNEAEAFRLALIGGVIPVATVIAWADAQIEAAVSPGIELIDLSLSGPHGVGGVVSALERLPGVTDTAAVSRRVLAWMDDALRRDPIRLPDVVRTLERMAIDDVVPDDRARSEMYGFDDQLSLADQRIYGTPELVLAEVQTFLRRYRT